MSNETQERGKALREKTESEEQLFAERKAKVPELLSKSGHDDLGSFVTALGVERKGLEDRGSFEKEHRDKTAEVTLTHRAAAELLLDEMEVAATSDGSSWEDVGISIAQKEAQVAEALQPVEYREIASASVGPVGGEDFKFFPLEN